MTLGSNRLIALFIFLHLGALPVAGQICGDGSLDAGEQCDDGGVDRGDGCSAACENETVLTKDEQRCVVSVTKALLRVARTQGKLSEACVKDAAKEKEEFPQICLRFDAKDKVAKAGDKATKAEAKKCESAPPFGVVAASIGNDVASEAMIGLVADLFGDNLNVAVVEKVEDKDAAKCQGQVLKNAHKLLLIETKTFEKCQRDGLKGKDEPQIVSGSDMQRCIEVIADDEKGKIAKWATKYDRLLSRTCAEVGLDWAFPGACADAADFTACVQERVACRVCELFDGMGNLGTDCDLFDDTEANASCG